jgi:hypothetical protein
VSIDEGAQEGEASGQRRHAQYLFQKRNLLRKHRFVASQTLPCPGGAGCSAGPMDFESPTECGSAAALIQAMLISRMSRRPRRAARRSVRGLRALRDASESVPRARPRPRRGASPGPSPHSPGPDAQGCPSAFRLHLSEPEYEVPAAAIMLAAWS